MEPILIAEPIETIPSKKATLDIMDGNEATAYIAYKTNEVCVLAHLHRIGESYLF